MSIVLTKCRSIASSIVSCAPFTLGNMGGNRFVRAISKPECDWTGTQDQQLASYKKISLIVVQILLTGTTFIILPTVSQACLAFFATYHIPFSSALTSCIQGGVVALIGSLGDYLVKRANGNWTPNKEKRILNLIGCDLTNSFWSYLILIRLSWIQSTVLLSSTNRIVSMIYDWDSEQFSQVLSRLANRVADCFSYCIAKSYGRDQENVKKSLKEKCQRYIEMAINPQKYIADMIGMTMNPQAYIAKKEIEILTEEFLEYAIEKMDQMYLQADDGMDKGRIKKTVNRAYERLERLKEPLYPRYLQNDQQYDLEELLERIKVELRKQLNQKYPDGNINRIEEIIRGIFKHLRALAKDDDSKSSDNSDELSEIKESEGDEVSEGGEGDEVSEGGEGDEVSEGGEGDEVSEGGEGDEVSEGGEGDEVSEGGEGDEVSEDDEV